MLCFGESSRHYSVLAHRIFFFIFATPAVTVVWMGGRARAGAGVTPPFLLLLLLNRSPINRIIIGFVAVLFYDFSASAATATDSLPDGAGRTSWLMQYADCQSVSDPINYPKTTKLNCCILE